MNRTFFNFFFLVIGCSFFNYSCQSGKQAASFKDSQQAIDTLALFSPHVVIESATRTERLPDDELALKLSNKISELTTSTLQSKYRLEDEPFIFRPNSDGEITSFFNALDSLETGLDTIQLPYWLRNDHFGSEDRYFLAMFIYGYYHPDYEPNYVVKQSLQTNTMLLGSSKLNWVSIKILLADRKTNSILYYNADDSYQSDPRLSSSVEAMIKKLIQPIYYR
jgi:hypothetical protein